MASETLKPCPNPWCSEVCSRMVKHGPCAFWVRCSCGVCGPCEDSRDDAIAAWNTRKPTDALVATLRAQVERLSATVSDEEWKYDANCFYDGTDHDYDVEAMERESVDALIAARKEARNG